MTASKLITVAFTGNYGLHLEKLYNKKDVRGCWSPSFSRRPQLVVLWISDKSKLKYFWMGPMRDSMNHYRPWTVVLLKCHKHQLRFILLDMFKLTLHTSFFSLFIHPVSVFIIPTFLPSERCNPGNQPLWQKIKQDMTRWLEPWPHSLRRSACRDLVFSWMGSLRICALYMWKFISKSSGFSSSSFNLLIFILITAYIYYFGLKVQIFLKYN